MARGSRHEVQPRRARGCDGATGCSRSCSALGGASSSTSRPSWPPSAWPAPPAISWRAKSIEPATLERAIGKHCAAWRVPRRTSQSLGLEHLKSRSPKPSPFVVACPACLVVWARRWCCWRRCSSQAPTSCSQRQHRLPARSRPTPTAAAVAAQRQLLDRRRAGSGRHARSPAAAWCRGATSARVPPASCSFISTGTRGATPTPRGCASGCAPAAGPAAATTTRPASGRRATGATSTSRRSACSPAAAPRSPTSRRSGTFIAPDDGNKDDRTVLSVPLPGAVAPGAVGDGGTGVDRARAAHIRAHRRRRQLLLHRAVVPEAGRARRHRLEHAPVPRRHRVLRRLRRVRRADHRAARLGRRRHRARARATRHAQGHDDASLRAGRRPRLRVDDQPGLRREDGDLRAPDAAAHRTAAAAAARACRAGRPAFRGDAGGAEVLRRVVRTVSLRPPHDRRSGLAEQRRRHGVPDAVHGGHAAGSRRRTSSDPEGVTVHEAGHQFWYGLVGNNEFEHAWLDEGLNQFSTVARASRGARADLLLRSGSSAGSSPGCSAKRR